MKHAREDYNRIQDPAGIIPDNEPAFLIRGQDKAAPFAVEAWAREAGRLGADKNIIDAAMWQANSMRAWQHAHGDKIPDMNCKSEGPIREGEEQDRLRDNAKTYMQAYRAGWRDALDEAARKLEKLKETHP